MKVLVTGGAGYIGAHMVLKLLAAGHHPVVVDNLSTGIRSYVPFSVPVHIIDIGDEEQLDQLFSDEKFAMVMHFAASIEVGESVLKPEKYYRNNFANTVTLLDVMRKNKVHQLIFSSTAAIFGEPQYVPANEEHPKNPINPYGLSKLMCEDMLKDFDTAYNIKSVCLRYFNAAGADAESRVGYRGNKESHLIPIALQAASGKRSHLEVFGRDYDTFDGTCVRDYIHVEDLCEAHLLAMNYLIDGGESRQFNLGNGAGYSVQQVIDAAKKVTGKEIKVVEGNRRAGDPASLLADATRAKQELGWKPKYSIEDMMLSAWKWQQNQS